VKPTDLLSAAAAARQLGITPTRVRVLCRAGRVPGAFQLAGRWAIPAAALNRREVRERKPGYPAGRPRT